jgi:predicted TPR repeat methyltransferase
MATFILPDRAHVAKLVDHWQQVDAALGAAIEAGAPTAQALGRLGVRLCMEQRLAESVAILSAAATLAANDADVWTNLAVALDRLGSSADAIHAAERSLQLSHNRPDTWLLLANMKKSQGDVAGARIAYETAAALRPNDALACQLLAIFLQEQHEYREALEWMVRCIKNGDTSAPALAILAQLFYQTGHFEKSRDAYAAALALDPQNKTYQSMHRETSFVCDALHNPSIDHVIDTYRDAVAEELPREGQAIPDLLQKTYSIMSGYGHTAAAQRVGEKILQLAPNSATAAYLLQALKGDSAMTRSPDAYLVEYFDKFADKFDHHLINTLGYAIPEKLCSALEPFLPNRGTAFPRNGQTPGKGLTILDAGCGTGLCGPHLRPFAQWLTGVDLSHKMLDQARQRNIYDHLICQELTSYLESSRSAFDVIVAADVFIYFGNLAPLIDAMAQALRPRGVLAFSIESTSAPQYQLLPSGRFAQSLGYVRDLLAPHFTECVCEEATIRIEAAHPARGALFVFRRNES